MPVKRPVDDDAGPPMPPKHSRQDLHIEYDPNASLAATARRKGASNRTGQACDRCKVRSQKNLGGKRKMESQKEREREREAMGGTRRWWKPMTQHGLTLHPTGPQDTLRPATRRLLALRPEQHRMLHHRPHNRPRKVSRPHGEPRGREREFARAH